jgi:hypothetical protein
MGSDADLQKIKDDTYATNFKTVGAEIDAVFNLEGLFDRLLNTARGALHSFTHSGLSQLGRRFTGNDLQARYQEDEILEVINVSSAGVFLATNLVAKHFRLEGEVKETERLFLEWGKH